MEHFNKLTPAEDERLALLVEEMGEVLQVIGKIQRHGYDNFHPDHPEITNRNDLEKELGHVRAITDMLVGNKDVDWDAIRRSYAKRLHLQKPYLHHQESS